MDGASVFGEACSGIRRSIFKVAGGESVMSVRSLTTRTRRAGSIAAAWPDVAARFERARASSSGLLVPSA